MLLLLIPLIQLAIIVLTIAGAWKTFTKAGQPGWAVIVPFYGNWVMAVEICKKDAVFFILSLIPLVNIIVLIEMAKKFGKEAGFGIGLGLLPFIFFPMLGFGDAQYQGGSSSGGKKKYGRSNDDYEDDDRDR
ncbi:MAG: DUF5684 domain-containing protein [Gemmataceae bacterium]